MNTKTIENLEQFLTLNQDTCFLIYQSEIIKGELKDQIKTCTIKNFDLKFVRRYKAIKGFKYHKHNNSCSFDLKGIDCAIYSSPIPTDRWGNKATYQSGLELKEGYYLIGSRLKEEEKLGEEIKKYFFENLQPKGRFRPSSLFYKIDELGWQSIESDFFNWLLSKHYSFVSRTLKPAEEYKKPAEEYENGHFFKWWYWTTNKYFDSKEWQNLFKDFAEFQASF